jgi:hypothetical protein
MSDDQKPFVPKEVEREHPVDGAEIPVDRTVHINIVPGEMEEADEAALRLEVQKYGTVKEPEIRS